MTTKKDTSTPAVPSFPDPVANHPLKPRSSRFEWERHEHPALITWARRYLELAERFLRGGDDDLTASAA